MLEILDVWDRPKSRIAAAQVLYYSFRVKINNRYALILCASEYVPATSARQEISRLYYACYQLSPCCGQDFLNDVGELFGPGDDEMYCEHCNKQYPELLEQLYNFSFWNESGRKPQAVDYWATMFDLSVLDAIVIHQSLLLETHNRVQALEDFTRCSKDTFEMVS